MLWFYSHKLKKYPFIGNMTAAILAVVPFFAIFVHYGNFDVVIFVHATFLFLLIAMRELVKDLENIKGDLTHGYNTIPVIYGENTSKRMLTVLSVLTLAPIVLLITKFKAEIGYMDYYFYASIAGLAVFLAVLWYSKSKIHYMVLHNILKLAIVLGVFSIVLIHVEFLTSRFF